MALPMHEDDGDDGEGRGPLLAVLAVVVVIAILGGAFLYGRRSSHGPATADASTTISGSSTSSTVTASTQTSTSSSSTAATSTGTTVAGGSSVVTVTHTTTTTVTPKPAFTHVSVTTDVPGSQSKVDCANTAQDIQVTFQWTVANATGVNVAIDSPTGTYNDPSTPYPPSGPMAMVMLNFSCTGDRTNPHSETVYLITVGGTGPAATRSFQLTEVN